MPSAEWEFGRPDDIRYSNRAEKAILETKNSIELIEYGWELADSWDGGLFFSPEILLEMHRITIQGLYGCAGSWRSIPLSVGDYAPPKRSEVRPLVADMCSRVNQMVNPFEASGYLLWRINWIHPFNGGNGRVSRAAACVALEVLLNEGRLAGDKDLRELIKQSHYDEYIAVLRQTDRLAAKAEDVEELNLSIVEGFMFDMYVRQIESAE